MSLPADLAAARNALPLPALMRAVGFSPPEVGGREIMSPFRVTEKPHFTLRLGTDGRLRAMDAATGDVWDEVDFLKDYKGMSEEEARKEYLTMAGVRREERRPPPARAVPAATLPPTPPPSDAPPDLMAAARESLAALQDKTPAVAAEPTAPFDWAVCREAMSPAKRQELATWRGWPVDFVDWLVVENLVGLYQGKYWAIPVDDRGTRIGCHYRLDNGDWLYSKGAKAHPLVWGAGQEMVVAFESQWDAYTFLWTCGAHLLPNAVKVGMKVCITRGAGNAKKLGEHYQSAKVIGFQQNDPPSEDGKPNGNEIWKKQLTEVWPGVEWAAPPEGVKDLNDWCRRDGVAMRAAAFEAVAEPKRERVSTMSVHSLWEIDQMEDDPPGSWLENEMIAEGETLSILGEGGVGKSRWTLQLIAHMILGRNFCGLKTEPIARQKRWLFIQGENRKRRLKFEIRALKESMGLTPVEFEIIAKHIFSTTLLKPIDFDLDTTDPERLAEITHVVDDFRPDGVVVDPLGDFTSADMNADEHMKKVADNIITAVQQGNVKRVVIIVHHAITGKDGAAKAVGWDASSFGRGSKALYNKVRSQINIAKVDPEDESRILIACGKNNNGPRFKPKGVILQENGNYIEDPDFDLDAWKEEVNGTAGKKDKGMTIPGKSIRELVASGGDTYRSLETRVAQNFNCSASMAKTAVSKAKDDGFLLATKIGHEWRLNRGRSD